MASCFRMFHGKRTWNTTDMYTPRAEHGTTGLRVPGHRNTKLCHVMYWPPMSVAQRRAIVGREVTSLVPRRPGPIRWLKPKIKITWPKADWLLCTQVRTRSVICITRRVCVCACVCVRETERDPHSPPPKKINIMRVAKDKALPSISPEAIT